MPVTVRLTSESLAVHARPALPSPSRLRRAWSFARSSLPIFDLEHHAAVLLIRGLRVRGIDRLRLAVAVRSQPRPVDALAGDVIDDRRRAALREVEVVVERPLLVG